MKLLLGLVVGLAVGVVGGLLFQQSLPPEEGSVAEKLELATRDLAKANQRVAALEAESGQTSRGKNNFKDRARRIAEDIKAGRDVSVDEVFGAFKPVMQDLAPLFDRIRTRDEKKKLDAIANELVRKYGLDASQEAALDRWVASRAELNAEAFNAVFASEATTFRDIERVTNELRQDEGLDEFMEGVLQGEALDSFREDRMMERVKRVQSEADRNTTRLDNIVDLDEDQKDAVFLVMAQGSRDFDPAMQFDGLGDDSVALGPGDGRMDAINDVLRPDQQQQLETYQQDKRTEAEEDLRAIGLSLPEDWDFYEEAGF